MKNLVIMVALLMTQTVFAQNKGPGDVGSVGAAATNAINAEVAVCTGKNGFNKDVEITVFRSLSKTNASILVRETSEKRIAFQNLLFTDATPQRNGNVFQVRHEKITIDIDLASEKADKTMQAKWDNSVNLTCKIVTPAID